MTADHCYWCPFKACPGCKYQSTKVSKYQASQPQAKEAGE